MLTVRWADLRRRFYTEKESTETFIQFRVSLKSPQRQPSLALVRLLRFFEPAADIYANYTGAQTDTKSGCLDLRDTWCTDHGCLHVV